MLLLRAALIFLPPFRDYIIILFFVISKKGRLQRKGRKNPLEKWKRISEKWKEKQREREKGGKKGIDESKSNASKKEEGVLMTNVPRALQSA